MLARFRLLICALFVLVLVISVHAETNVYSESPLLAEKVAIGQLPPIEKRLPENPMLIQPQERVGDYGGTWRMGLRGYLDRPLLRTTIGYEGLVRWHAGWGRVIPDVAEAYEVNADATAFTFHLRKGMRWSDGAPFTADDIMFWYEDVIMHENFAPPPTWWIVGGEPGRVEKIDDTTVIFRFSAPYGLFLQILCTTDGVEPTSYPRHYLQKFHVDYNPNVNALVEQEGARWWGELFSNKGGNFATRFNNPEMPTLNAWQLATPYVEGIQQVVAERNPYYWKVDTNFNQLPYIDRVVFTVYDDFSDALIDSALAGNIDMQISNISEERNRTRLLAVAEQRQFRLFETTPATANTLAISLNMTHKDPLWREIFQNKEFRIGLSYAINRQAIIDALYPGHGVPAQVAPPSQTPFYNLRLDTQYTEYNVELANEYLDRAGYSTRDSEDFRLRPDGQRIAFKLVAVAGGDEQSNETQLTLEMVKTDWAAVGILIELNIRERNDFTEYVTNNDHDSAAFQGEGGLDALLSPRYYFPYRQTESHYAIAWARWYNQPDHPIAQEPPAIVQQQMQLYNQITATANQDQQFALMSQILDITADQFYVIGIARRTDSFGLVKNNFMNVPRYMPAAWTYPSPGPTKPEQYFIDTNSSS